MVALSKKLDLLDGFDQADHPSAMKLLEAHRYKLVVSDGNIPGGDGAELYGSAKAPLIRSSSC